MGYTESELNPLRIVSTPCGSNYERTARLARLTSVGGPLRLLSFNSSISIVYLQKKLNRTRINHYRVITTTMSVIASYCNKLQVTRTTTPVGPWQAFTYPGYHEAAANTGNSEFDTEINRW